MLVILLLFLTKNVLLWSASHSDYDSDTASVFSEVEDYTNNMGALFPDNCSTDKKSAVGQADAADKEITIKKFLMPAYDFSEEERACLTQEVYHLQETQPEKLENAIQLTTTYKHIFPFAPHPRILLWCLTSSNLIISIKSFIPSLVDISSHELEPITAALQSLPAFFTRTAFNEVNSNYLEGGTPLLQKWINVAATCAAVKNETDLIIDPRERFEVASHLMLFMQYRSIDLIRYYSEALLSDVKHIEDNYYSFYCLSRRLKGDSVLQDKLLRRLASCGNEGHFNIAFSLSKKLHRTIQKTRGCVGVAVEQFVSEMIESDKLCTKFLALPEP